VRGDVRAVAAERTGGDVLTYATPGGRFYRLLSVGGSLTCATAPDFPYPYPGLR
jgi:hypothetical protein